MFGETNSLDGTNNDNRFLKKQLKVKKAFYFYILFSNVDETNGFETEIVGTRRKVSTRVQDVPIKDTRAVTRPRTRQLHTRWVGGGDTGGLTGARSAGVEIPREPRGKATAETESPRDNIVSFFPRSALLADRAPPSLPPRLEGLTKGPLMPVLF